MVELLFIQLVGNFASEEDTAKQSSSDEEDNHRNQPRAYIGPISDLVKKLPKGMQLIRV